MPTPMAAHLAQLRATITKRPPHRSGTLDVSEGDLTIFYGTEEEAHRISPFTASDTALGQLARACAPATFGRNDDDVLDETYRKAGKLDAADFCVKLDLGSSGLLDLVQGQLLEGPSSVKKIRAELYKLNVYGVGSFFKSHKDTPRGRKMFGSLVVVYPTGYEGGVLVFHDGDKQYEFDSAAAISRNGGPCIAYAAFFSDLDHEVTPVTSGYRVTITYNLYFDSDLPFSVMEPDTTIFDAELRALLNDPTFLRNGSYLGFGLRHVYPIEKISNDRDQLRYLKDCLKGSDADILATCQDLSLDADLWALYRPSDADWKGVDYSVLCRRPPNLGGEEVDEGVEPEDYIVKRYGGKRIPPIDPDDYGRERADDKGLTPDVDEDEAGPEDSDDSSESDFEDPRKKKPTYDMVVHWVTRPSSLTVMEDNCIVYGNEHTLQYVYGHVVLIVRVPRVGAGIRETVGTKPEAGASAEA